MQIRITRKTRTSAEAADAAFDPKAAGFGELMAPSKSEVPWHCAYALVSVDLG